MRCAKRVAGTLVLVLMTPFVVACKKDLCSKCTNTTNCSAELFCAARKPDPNVVVVGSGEQGFCVNPRTASDDLSRCEGGGSSSPTPPAP